MSLKVVTKNSDKLGRETVYVQYFDGTDSKRFPTGVKVKPGGMEDGRLAKCAGAAWKEHNASIVDGNAAIEKTSSTLAFLIRRYNEDQGEKPSGAVLEELWKSQKGAKDAEGAKATFWQHFAEYEGQLKAKVTPTKEGYSTARGLKPLRTLLLEFERARGIKISLASIDYRMLSAFNDFMLSHGHLNSTVRTRMARLKAMLNHFVRMGISNNVAFRDYKRDRKHKDAPLNQRIVALHDDELKELLALELDCPRLRYARALFALCAGTGLRFSDAIRVGPNHVDGENIRITTKKTGEELTIPLNWLSRLALAEFPQMRSTDLGLYNERLVKLGEMCKTLHRPFIRTTFSGLSPITNEDKTLKYHHLSSHAGRKTFVTRCLMQGVPEFKIRKWTGHKNLESFSKYVDNVIGEADMMSRF